MRIVIVGPGLLGGSIALAIRESLPDAELAIWARREEARHELREHGFAESQVFAELADATEKADLLILATPVGAMGTLARQIAATPNLAPEAIVTDVGSVKGVVVAEMEPIFQEVGIAFIGSHPMAGSEKTGLAHADARLLEGSRCIITPSGQSGEQIARLQDFWTKLGTTIFTMDPAEHDRVVARISHLPHAAASAIVLAALKEDRSPLDCSGGGFRDTTRVAAGSPEMWAEILLENQAEVIAALEDLSANLSEMLEFLRKRDQKNLASYLTSAKELRDRLGGDSH